MDTPVRTDERYFADIRAVLKHFYQAGDSLRLLRKFWDTEKRKCEMCGGGVDINLCYQLQNVRTGKIILCGRRCIVNYAIIVEEMQQVPHIVFPSNYQTEAEAINKMRPNTIELDLEDEMEFGEPPGESVGDAAWELCDCGVELSFCEECDNEICPQCDRGCRCDGEEDDYDDECI